MLWVLWLSTSHLWVIVSAIGGGNNQTAIVNTAFANPLQVTVASNATPTEPVDGGTVTFTPPASGAGAVLSGSPAVISGGAASMTATANNTVGGPYAISANASGANAGVDFSLTNEPVCYSALTVANANDSGTGSLRQAIARLCSERERRRADLDQQHLFRQHRDLGRRQPLQ